MNNNAKSSRDREPSIIKPSQKEHYFLSDIAGTIVHGREFATADAAKIYWQQKKQQCGPCDHAKCF